jgi:hypothetical protein
MSTKLSDLIRDVEHQTIPNSWTDCPRKITTEEMIIGLARGRVLYCDRRDAPELPYLETLQKLGYVGAELQELDEQSSRLRFFWVKGEVTVELVDGIPELIERKPLD